MPSGSHGGGSGGSHFGGGSFGGSNHNSFGRHNDGQRNVPILFHIGPTYYNVSPKKSSFLSILIFALIFFIISLVGVFIDSNSNYNNIRKIKQDYTYYQNMITYSEMHTEYQINGIITGKFLNENNSFGKWYLTYSFEANDHSIVDGYTFSIYDSEQIKNFQINDTIALAIDSLPITQKTDSVNLDYKNTALKDDGEYQSLITNINFKRLEKIFFSALILLIITTMIIIIFTSKDKDKTEIAHSEKIKQFTKCEYCNSVFDARQVQKCPNCGANVKLQQVEIIENKNKENVIIND